jgi:hypothetical protein
MLLTGDHLGVHRPVSVPSAVQGAAENIKRETGVYLRQLAKKVRTYLLLLLFFSFF